MFFSRPISDLTYEDVEEFCGRFQENIRVEYKSTFDNNVKNKLPRVLSSFANSYGGVLIIGVVAPAGVPQEPFDGIIFPEREPGLTVQNICREGIFPDIPLYTRLVPSRVQGKAFLVVQVNESAKAPHAIENSTLVHVRTEGSTERITLADIARIERMLLRRADVSRRWDDFFAESWEFGQSVYLDPKYPYFEIRMGVLYPAENLINREKIYDFLTDYKNRELAGFRLGQLLRSPIGALLARDQNVERFLNIGELGILHYAELLYGAGYQGEAKTALDFWSVSEPILKMLRLIGSLIEYAGTNCELRIETYLRNIAGQSFSSGTNPHLSLAVRTVADSVQASAQIASSSLPASALETTVHLMYQLRWPFGEQQAPTLENVRQTVEGRLKGV
jgi:hypothetical protein